MNRHMTPAQYANMIRQAQQKQQQAIDAYNREVRRVNDHNKRVLESRVRAINEYNRRVDDHNRQAINNYNHAVSTYNSQVRANQQRLRNEIARLNSKPAVAVQYVTYQTSVQTLRQSFAHVENAADQGDWKADADLFDMAEGEIANSVSVLNALNADSSESQFNDPDIRKTIITSELNEIDPDLDSRWKGALFSLNPENPDAARHFCTSARELIAKIVDNSVSDDAVKAADPNYPKTPKGDVSRRARIQYCLARIGQAEESLVTFVDNDIENVIALFNDFNSGAHGSAGTFDLPKLKAIKTRVEHAIQFLHRIVKYN